MVGVLPSNTLVPDSSLMVNIAWSGLLRTFTSSDPPQPKIVAQPLMKRIKRKVETKRRRRIESFFMTNSLIKYGNE
jgi:hypothetical protein